MAIMMAVFNRDFLETEISQIKKVGDNFGTAKLWVLPSRNFGI